MCPPLLSIHFPLTFCKQPQLTPTMARNKSKRKRPQQHDDDQQQKHQIGWSTIPGRRLAVDIADNHKPSSSDSGGVAAAKKEHHHNNNGDSSDDGSFNHHSKDEDDDEAYLNTTNWTSHHYEYEDTETFNKTAESEFWDPNPMAPSNKFDVGSKVVGANDDGMFLRLVPSYFLIVFLSCVYMLKCAELNFLSYVTIIFFAQIFNHKTYMIYIIVWK